MTEHRIIVDRKVLHYEGSFSQKDVLQELESLFAKKKYVPKPANHDIVASEKGRKHTISLEFVKKANDYDDAVIDVKIACLEKEKKGEHYLGTVDITFRGRIKSNREHFYGYFPLSYTLSVMYSKFFRKSQMDKSADDIADVIKEVQDNVYVWLEHVRKDKNRV